MKPINFILLYSPLGQFILYFKVDASFSTRFNYHSRRCAFPTRQSYTIFSHRLIPALSIAVQNCVTFFFLATYPDF